MWPNLPNAVDAATGLFNQLKQKFSGAVNQISSGVASLGQQAPTSQPVAPQRQPQQSFNPMQYAQPAISNFANSVSQFLRPTVAPQQYAQQNFQSFPQQIQNFNVRPTQPPQQYAQQFHTPQPQQVFRQAISNAFPITQLPQQIGQIGQNISEIENARTPQDYTKLGLSLAAGMVGEAPNINNTVQSFANKLTKEDVGLIGQAHQIIETKGPQANLGSVGPDYQRLAEHVFGEQAATWGNAKLKNAFDQVLGRIGQRPNTAGLGLNAQPLRSITGVQQAVEGLQPFGETKGIQPEAAKNLQGIMDTIKQNRANYDDPSYFSKTLISQPTWEEFLKSDKDINNHAGGPNAMKDEHGYLGYITTDARTVPPQGTDKLAIDNHVVQQFTENNGDRDLSIVREIPSKPGTFTIQDGHHSFPSARAIGIDKIPAIIVDPKGPSLADMYDALKNGSMKPVDIKGGIPLAQQTAAAQVPQGEAAISPARLQELAPEYSTQKGQSQIQSVIDRATKVKPQLDNIFTQMAQKLGLQPNDFESRIKNPDTVVQKIAAHRLEGTDQYNLKGVNDIWGGRLVVDTPEQKQQIIQAMNQLDKNGSLDIIKQQPVDKSTYHAFHIDFQKNGVNGELQIHTPQSLLESTVNHDIRAQAGEKPPLPLEAEKQLNAKVSQAMPSEEAQIVSKKIEEQHKSAQQPDFEKEMDQMVANRPQETPPPSGKAPPPPPEPLQPTKNQVTVKITGQTEKERIQSAVVNSERVSNELNIRGKDAYVAGSKLSPQDLKLAEGYEHGVPIETLAQQSSNPQAFTQFMGKLTNYYDFRLATDRAVGGETNLRQNYLPHHWDLSNPADLTKFNDMARQKGVKPWDGFSSQPRVFDTYNEGELSGFKRENPNILGDLKDDFGGASVALSRQALRQGLQEAVPSKVNGRGTGYTPEGKPFINSNLPGLEGLSYHPDVADQLKGFTPLSGKDLFSQIKEKGFVQGIKDTGVWNSVLSLYDHATGPMKQFLLNFSGFHSLNVSASFAGESVLNPVSGAKGLAQSIPSFFSEGVTQNVIDGLKNKAVPGKDYSVFDAGLRSGVNMDRSLPSTGLSKVNPFTALSGGIFNRELHTLKLNLVDQVFGDGRIDPESPQGRAAAKEINLVMGEINNRTMNINPNTQKWLSRGLLAPQFTESKYSILKDAFTQAGAGGDIARKAVIGKSLVLGTLSTLGTLLATGKFPTLQQTLTNFTTSPTIQTNITNPKGIKQDVALPSSFISEPARPLAGLVKGDTSPLNHYLQARLNPVLSKGISAYTNKDYYGNPVVNPSSKTPITQQLTQNLGINSLPIGAQNVIRQLQGKQTTAQTAINIAGLRTMNSSTDAKALAQKTYFDSLKSASDSLDSNEQKVFTGLLHPTKKDADGNPIVDKTPYTKPAQFAALLNDSKLMATEQQFQLGQSSHHPMWDLPPQQLKAYLQEQLINGVDPSGDKATVNALKSILPKDFNTQVSQYYRDLTAQGIQLASKPGQAQLPKAPSSIQGWQDLKDQGKPTSSYLQQHPELINYFQSLSNYTNAQRSDMGLPLLAAIPTQSSSRYGGYSGGGAGPNIRNLTPAMGMARLAVPSAGLPKKVAPSGAASPFHTALANFNPPRTSLLPPSLHVSAMHMPRFATGGRIKLSKQQHFKIPAVRRFNLRPKRYANVTYQ